MIRSKERFILYVISDTHGGQTLGLLNPETKVVSHAEDGSLEFVPVSLNPAQEYLWGLYEKNIKAVRELAGKDEIIVIHNGDLSQGNKYFDDLLYSSMANQVIIAQSNMKPILDIPNVNIMRLTWGTSSHIFKEGTTPVLVQQNLALRYPQKDIKSTKHGLMKIKRFWIDYAHHGTSAGIRAWLRGNQYRYYIKSIIFDELKAGNIPPDIIIRSHFHTKVEEWVVEFFEGKRHKTVGVITPSFTLMNEYARQATRSKPTVTNGSVAFEFYGDKLVDVHWFTETKDVRTKEIIK